MYKIRVILDDKKDVIRTFTINNKVTLETLHYTIAESFGFDAQEIASFYRTDNQWTQGEEIPLLPMEEADTAISMASEKLHNTLTQVNSKLIYVYDFLHLWTFYVEVVEITETTISKPKIILSVGEIPQNAPKKEFKTEKSTQDLDDDFDNFESLDDYDF